MTPAITSADLRALLHEHRERYDAVRVFADEAIDGDGIEYPLGSAVAQLSLRESDAAPSLRLMRRALALRQAREAKGTHPELVPPGVAILIGGTIGDSDSRWIGLRQFQLGSWVAWGTDASNGMVRWMKESLLA